jgi:hypothetical protein
VTDPPARLRRLVIQGERIDLQSLAAEIPEVELEAALHVGENLFVSVSGGRGGGDAAIIGGAEDETTGTTAKG